MSKNVHPQDIMRAEYGVESPNARPDAVSRPGEKTRVPKVSDTATERIDIRGRFQLRLPAELSRLRAAAPAREQREFSFRCSSGERTAGVWTGIPLETLVDAVRAPPATTHLHVVGDDGHTAQVAIVTALDGILALRRDDQPPDNREEQATASQNGIPRLLVPRADSSQMVRNVRSIAAISLPPDADPSTGSY